MTFIEKLRNYFHVYTPVSLFLLLDENGDIVDAQLFANSTARKPNELDYAFGEFMNEHLSDSRSCIFTPPFRLKRYDLEDKAMLPTGFEASICYITDKLLPFIQSKPIEPLKDFSFRELHFCRDFDVYDFKELAGSIGTTVNRIEPKELTEYSQYDWYLQVLALQDKRHEEQNQSINQPLINKN